MNIVSLLMLVGALADGSPIPQGLDYRNPDDVKLAFRLLERKMDRLQGQVDRLKEQSKEIRELRKVSILAAERLGIDSAAAPLIERENKDRNLERR